MNCGLMANGLYGRLISSLFVSCDRSSTEMRGASFLNLVLLLLLRIPRHGCLCAAISLLVPCFSLRCEVYFMSCGV